MAPSPTTSIAQDIYYSDPIVIGDTSYVVGHDENIYRLDEATSDAKANPISTMGAFRHYPSMDQWGFTRGTDAHTAALAQVSAGETQAQARFANRPYPCNMVGTQLRVSFTVVAGHAYCARCADEMFRRSLWDEHAGAHSGVGIFGTFDPDAKGSAWADVRCGDPIPVADAKGGTWQPLGPLGGNWTRLIASAKRDDRPGPFDYLLTQSATNPLADRKPTPRPRTVTTPKPTPAEPTLPGVDWEQLYHVAEANVILLQGENTRLRARLAQLGVSVTGPLGLATIS